MSFHQAKANQEHRIYRHSRFGSFDKPILAVANLSGECSKCYLGMGSDDCGKNCFSSWFSKIHHFATNWFYSEVGGVIIPNPRSIIAMRIEVLK